MGQRHRVLIVDDSRDVVAAMKAFLERKYDVFTAYDGIQGLHTLEENEDCIDIVITDLLMPELSGFGLTSILKKKYPRIPIIAITGWRGNIEASGAKLNADLILEKPFDMFDLDRSVSGLLGSKKSSSHTGAGSPGH